LRPPLQQLRPEAGGLRQVRGGIPPARRVLDRGQHPPARGSCLSTAAPLRRVLVVEDSEDDFLLMRREFAAAGYEPAALQRVDTPEALRRVLVSDDWSVVLSDYTMPRFNALDALGLVRELRPEI